MMSKLGRRAGAMLIGACLALTAGLAPGAAQEELRIGFIAPMTGTFAQVGKDMVDGFNMYLDETKGEFAGAKVKLIVEDDQGKPDTARHQGEEADPSGQGAHAGRRRAGLDRLCARAGVSTADKTVYIASVPAADDLTQRDARKYPYFIRTGWTSSQPHHPLGQWACDQGYKKIVAIAADYAFGYEVGRRLPEGVRGLRRQDRPENLAAARHQGFRALHPDHQGRCRRGVLADGRADGAAISQAAARSPATRSRSSAAARATTSSRCRSWATR